LGWLIIFVFVFNGVSWGGIRWWRANEYWKDFLFALENYERSFLCEKPAHGVTISAPFYMGKYEVTNEQYETVMGINPGKYLERNLPVGWLSFYDAQAFCQKVKEITGTKVRLPTEAEWEYACRAGTKSIFNSGNEIKDLMDSGWFENNSRGRAHPVGQKQPNAFALHDMHGNEREWCQDWYGEYTSSSKIDPQGPSHGPFRVLRGGHYSSEVLYCRSSMRINCELGNKYFSGGFRVVLCVR
jgi:formylglycine-generating enzyme required for sulfatase activity